jgi:hypothetical protein
LRLQRRHAAGKCRQCRYESRRRQKVSKCTGLPSFRPSRLRQKPSLSS